MYKICLLWLTCYANLCASSRNPYDVLGLKQGTSISDAKLKFRELSKQYHPDKNQDPRAEVKYKEITDAYQKIVDNEQGVNMGQKGRTEFQNYQTGNSNYERASYSSSDSSYSSYKKRFEEFSKQFDQNHQRKAKSQFNQDFSEKKEQQDYEYFKKGSVLYKISRQAESSLFFQAMLIFMIFCILNCVYLQFSQFGHQKREEMQKKNEERFSTTTDGME